MFKAYKITIEQKNLVDGKEFTKDSIFSPFQDYKGDYYISIEEVELCDNTEFNWVKNLILEDFIREIPTPPTPTGYGVVIPSEFLWVFIDDNFILNVFEIPLVNTEQGKAVDCAYFLWQEFRNELDSGKYVDLKRHLMPLWDYVELQVINQNLIVL